MHHSTFNNINNNHSIIEKKFLKDEFKQVFNIGVFTLKLLENKEEQKKENKSMIFMSFDKKINNSNTLYYDVSIIINLIKLEKIEYQIEFIIKDVTNYFRGYEKLKNKLNYSYLYISKFIHKFKFPLDWIIGLSKKTKLFMDSTENTSLNIFNFIKEDIEKINNLSNYSVFLIEDIMIILGELIKNKNEDFFKENNDSVFEENLNPNITQSRIERTIKFLKKSSSIKSNNNMIKKNSIHLKNYSFFQILNFSYSILSTLIKCSESKSKKFLPKLTISEDIKNFMIYIDQIKLKQILLNLISKLYLKKSFFFLNY